MTNAVGRGAQAGRRRGWFGRFLRDLFTPRGTIALLPPVPRTPEQVGKELLVRSLVAQVISGRDTTFLEKAAYVASPEIVSFVAHRGARSGAASRASQPLPPPPNGPRRSGPFDRVIDV